MDKKTHCQECSILSKKYSNVISSNIKPNSRAIIIVDYPSIEDNNNEIIMTELSERTTKLMQLLNTARINPDIISYGSVQRCITKSKQSLTYQNYKYCGQILLSEIEHSEIEVTLCFGGIAGRLLTEDKNAETNLNKLRGKVYYNSNIKVHSVITYNLSTITSASCCGSTIHLHLIKKDIMLFRSELLKRNIIK